MIDKFAPTELQTSTRIGYPSSEVWWYFSFQMITPSVLRCEAEDWLQSQQMHLSLETMQNITIELSSYMFVKQFKLFSY